MTGLNETDKYLPDKEQKDYLLMQGVSIYLPTKPIELYRRCRDTPGAMI
jgi:hypothetical protein